MFHKNIWKSKQKKQNDQLFRDLCLFRDRGDMAIKALIEITKRNRFFARGIARRALKEIAEFYTKNF